MKILLSIKPKFVDEIFSGKKRYEFRRSIFKREGVKTVVVYASDPVQKVIGEFEVGNILREDIHTLWEKTRKHSGITEECFYNYFEGKDEGFAIKIKKYKKYKRPLYLKKSFRVSPPQSYVYL